MTEMWGKLETKFMDLLIFCARRVIYWCANYKYSVADCIYELHTDPKDAGNCAFDGRAIKWAIQISYCVDTFDSPLVRQENKYSSKLVNMHQWDWWWSFFKAKNNSWSTFFHYTILSNVAVFSFILTIRYMSYKGFTSKTWHLVGMLSTWSLTKVSRIYIVVNPRLYIS